MIKKFYWPLILCIALTGCARERIVAPGSDPATVDLAQVALSINRSMQDLAATDQAEPLRIKKQAIDPNTYGMGRLASVEWNGPAEPLIRRLASLTHYRVKVYGNPTAIPVLVAVNEREQYIGDVLRQVSLQSREYMKLLVYPSAKIIEIHYLGG